MTSGGSNGRGAALGVALACVLGAVRPAAAQGSPREGPLRAAEAAYAQGRLAEAGVAYEAAIAAGRLERDGLVRAHLRLGLLARLGAEDDRARRHFVVALALRPDVPAPEALDAEAGFEALRRARDGERLRAVLETSDPSEPVRVDVRGAPEGLVRTVELSGRGGFARRLRWTGRPLAVEAPAAARPLFVRVLDAHGNRLAEAGTPPAPEAPGAPSSERPSSVREPTAEPVGPDDDEGPSLIESPWLWIAVGLVAVGAGVAIGVSASGDRFVLDAPVVR
ncbi:MAG TPA: hypothetical protein RMH99_23020 [Sandaracinaceae bacterium LLY-WYZ-13_1]|nr:hypothetical protein [Sandaracinaceae bacterium LLY-WYZ-13_1]